MQDKNRAKIIISSEQYTPEDITKNVGFECDEFWRKGEFREIGERDGKKIYSKEKMQDNGWVLYSSLNESAAIEEHIEALLTRLSPYKNNIQNLSHECEVEFACFSWQESGYTFPIFLEKEQVKAISDLGACLGFDLYAVGDDEEIENS